MRFACLTLVAALAGCSSIPPPAQDIASGEGPQPGDTIETVTVQVGEPDAPEASGEELETCAANEADVNLLFDATPTTWVPQAATLLGCSIEAIGAMEWGDAERAGADDVTVLTFSRQRPRGQANLVLFFGPSGAIGVSIAEEVPERLTETVFTLRAVQAQEAAGADPIPSPEATVVFPATELRAYGIRLVTSGAFLVLSVVQE